MKAKKKLLSLLLAAAMVMSLLPTAAFAAKDTTDGSPSVAQLAAIGYKISPNSHTWKFSETTSIYYNDEELKTISAGAPGITFTTLEYVGTNSDKVGILYLFAALEFLQAGASRALGQTGAEKDITTSANYNEQQISSPLSVNDLNIDSSGRIYFNFVDNRPGKGAPVTKFYLNEDGTIGKDSGGTTVPTLVNFTATAGDNGSVSVAATNSADASKLTNNGSGSYTVVDGTSVTLTATGNSGFEFDKWSGADTSSVSPLIVTPTANASYTAAFKASSRTVTITLGNHMSKSGGGNLTQTVSGAITNIDLTADTNYIMPETWNVGSGLTYTRSPLNSASASIAGTPTANVTATVPDAIKNVNTVTVTNSDTNITATGTLTQNVTAGQAMSNVTLSVNTANGWQLPTGITISPTDGGISYSSATGVISGTPTKDVTVTIPASSATQKTYNVNITTGLNMTGGNLSQIGITHGASLQNVTLSPWAGYVLPSAAVVNSGVLSGTGLTYAIVADGTATITGTVTKDVTAAIPDAIKVTVTPDLTDAGATLVIDPSDPNTEYAVITSGTPGTTVNTGDWTEGNNGKLTLTVPAPVVGPLQVVSRPKTPGTGNGTNLGDAVGYYYVANADASEGHLVAGASGNAGTKDAPLDTINNAYAKIGTGKTGFIIVLDELTVTATIDLSADKTVTITSENANVARTVKRDPNMTGISGMNNLVQINHAKSNVTLKNIVLDGNKGSMTALVGTLVYLHQGNLVLDNRAVLQNNQVTETSTTASHYGGGLYLRGDGAAAATATMKAGAIIRDNQASWGGGVHANFNGSTFTMEGGTITGNSAVADTDSSVAATYTGFGGGVSGFSSTGNVPTIHIKGGTISGNTANGKAGGVYADIQSGNTPVTLNISGNITIDKNTVNGASSNVYLGNGQTIKVPAAVTGKVGVYVQTMPATAGQKVPVAEGVSHTITDVEAKNFFSDKTTQAGIILESNTVKLSFDARTKIDPGVTPGGEGFITIDPQPGEDYGILTGIPAEVNKGVTVTDKDGVVLPGPDPTTGWITLPGKGEPGYNGPYTVKPLPKGEEVNIVTRPKGDPTYPEPGTLDPTATVTIPGVGGNLHTTQTPVTIVVDPADPTLKYALLSADGSAVVIGWKDPVSGKVVFGVAPDATLTADTAYKVVTMKASEVTDPNTPDPKTAEPKVSVKIPPTVDPVDTKDVTRYPDGSGKDTISVNPTVTGQTYWLVDKTTGMVVAPATGAGTGFTSPDADGYVTAGDNNGLTFTGLDPEHEYEIRTTVGNPAGDPALLPIEPVPVKPVTVDPGSITGSILKNPDPNPGKTQIVINPADPNKKYAVIDPETGLAVDIGEAGGDPWTPGGEGKVVLKPLAPGKEYIIVTKDKDDTTTDPGDETGIKITTPLDPEVKKINPEDIERERATSPNEGKDKITVTDPGSGYEVAVIDPATGEEVTGPNGEKIGTWQPGGSGDLTFAPMEPNKEYEVVIRPTTPADSIRVPAVPGVPVPKIGDMSVSGKVVDADGNGVGGATVKVTVALLDGGYQTITVTTKPDGTYELTGSGIKLPGDYAVYVDSAKGVGVIPSAPVTFTKAQPQELANITVTKNTPESETSIAGGTVSHMGDPVVGSPIVVTNKQTGEVLTLNAPNVVSTTDGGGYVLTNLPNGTYFVQTSDGTNSGLTEITVKDGKVEPNKKGGHNTTNISTTKGGIIDGKVENLLVGETAKVSVTVPIYNEAGAEIGAKTVTAIAEGASGLWKIAGVPDGKYPVTVTTPKGTLTGELTVTGGKAASVTQPGGGDEMDVTSDELVITAPTTADPDKKPGTITGVAVGPDANGNMVPVKNATVNIYDEKGDIVGTTTTGEGGGYTVTGLPDGNYYISVDNSGKNGLTGPVKVTGTKTEGKTNVTVSDTASKLLEGTVKLQGGTNPAVGATVVVKDSTGNVIATTTTNASGQYFVGSVPANATVSIVTADKKEEGKPINMGSGAVLNGDATTAKVGENLLTVIGPDGGALPVQPGTATDNNTAQIIVKGPKPSDAVVSPTITGGKLDVTGLADGKYDVTVETGNGMEVTKEITVGTGKITSGAPFAITTAEIKGKVKYEVGTIPTEATISIPGIGTDKVNTSTGEYTLPGVPDGTYTATIVVKDKDGSDTTCTAILTVTNGVAEYSNPLPGTAAEVGSPKTNLVIKPTDSVKAVNTKIGTAKDAIDEAKADPAKVPAAITAVKDALDEIDALTDEGRRQLDPDTVKELSDALTGLLTDLKVNADATGVSNTSTVKTALENQKNLLVTETEMNTAAAVGKKVDVTLTLKAKDATNDPTPAVQKDMSKVEALATAKNVEKVGYYDVTVEKKTVVKENDAPVSTTVTTVPELPTPVKLTLAIPADLLGRQYYGVVRVHQNGSAERIPSEATATTVTFSSALYSTFAILASNDPIFEDDAAATTDPTPGPSTGTGTGGGSSVTVPTHPGGTVTVNPTNPGKGEDIIITVKPDEGYVLDKLTVKDPSGKELVVTPMGGGKYKVTMPDPAVKLTVDATFKKLSNDPHNNGVSDLLNVDDHIAYMKGRAGGKFAPADSMTRAEVAQMFYNLLKTKDTNLGNKASFNDIPADAWYSTAVNTLANIGIVNGTGGGNFDPDRTITRAEFIAIAARFADVATGGDTFSDVPATHWAYKEITTATAYGWISGYGDGSFKPGNNIARSEAVKVVNAMLARSADKAFVDAAKELITFPDVPKTDWAYYPIIEATNAHDFELKDSAETWKSK